MRNSGSEGQNTTNFWRQITMMCFVKCWGLILRVWSTKVFYIYSGDPCWCLTVESGVVVGWQGVGPAWQSGNWGQVSWFGLYKQVLIHCVSLSSLQTDACLPRWRGSLKFWFFWFSFMHHTTFIYTIFTACTSHTTDSTDFHTSCYCLIWFIHMIDLNKHFLLFLCTVHLRCFVMALSQLWQYIYIFGRVHTSTTTKQLTLCSNQS